MDQRCRRLLLSILPRRSPLLGQEGTTPRHQNVRSRGRGGQCRMTTPSVPSKVASRYFLGAQPPLLSQEGTTRVAIFVLLFLFIALPVQAQTTRISLEATATGFSTPVYFTSAKDGTNRRFVIEQVG